MDQLLQQMKEIGFTQYEAKIYIALLQHSPATGYEISKLSNVPQSKVYENITRLANDDIILSVGTDPIKYVPLSSKELLKNKRTQYDKSLSNLQNSFSNLKQTHNLEYVWNITGYQATMDKASQMINQATEQIMISLWNDEAIMLHDELLLASNRGVDIKVLIYGKDEIIGLNQVYRHGKEEQLLPNDIGRWLTLVTDGKEVITGQITGDSEGVAIWTTNSNIIFVSSRYIVHEIYIASKINRRSCDEVDKNKTS